MDADPGTLHKWLLSKVTYAGLEPCEEVLGDSACGFLKVCVCPEPPLGCLVIYQADRVRHVLWDHRHGIVSAGSMKIVSIRAKSGQACWAHHERKFPRLGDPQLCVLCPYGPLCMECGDSEQ